jgi:hypothetical protein
MKREELLEQGLNDAIVFDNPEYDEAIIGFDINSCRVIYDYNKMVDYLVRKEGISEEDAEDFISYNTIRACPYMGDKAPIIMWRLDNDK